MKKIIIIIVSLVVLLIGGTLGFYLYNLAPVSNSDLTKTVLIEQGTSSEIANTLKANNLIKSVNIFKLYLKIHGISNLKASSYDLKENMSLPQIVRILEKGNSYNPDQIKILFKEGYNVRGIADKISEITTNSSEEVLLVLQDSEYIDYLIDKYWFLTDDIKNKDIYYPLEGYLFPETYIFMNKEVSVKIIFEKMLDEMEKQLEPFREDINNSNYSIHEIMTVASLVEMEGKSSEDRAGVAGVIYNRVRDNWSLGLDATTYYAVKKDKYAVGGLSQNDLNNCSSKYNTRCSNLIGLPVGPIASFGLDSLKAAIYPEKHDYYYFVSDCSGKIYFTKNSYEHNNMINKLDREGNWCA